MGFKGEKSKAHEYNKSDCCIHCGVYKVNIEKMSLACKPTREKAVAEAKKAG